MHFVDHIFMLLLFVAQPIHGALSYRRYLRRIEAGEPADRVRMYFWTIVLEWSALFVLFVSWFFLRRPPGDLGFVSPGGTGFYVGAVLLAAMCGWLLYSWVKAKNMTGEDRAKQLAALGDLVHFAPSSQRDLRWFVSLSLTAGIVEEIVYRGFVIWYLALLMPAWAAVLVSSVGFGLGHSYQGISGASRCALIGLALGFLYLLTGSIWLPILAHFLFDALQGLTLVEILRPAARERATAA